MYTYGQAVSWTDGGLDVLKQNIGMSTESAALGNILVCPHFVTNGFSIEVRTQTVPC